MQINQPQMHTTGQENREIKSQAAAMDATDGGGGSSAAASVMTLEQKIAAMEKDVKGEVSCVPSKPFCLLLLSFLRAHRLHSHPQHTPLLTHTTPERLQAVEAAQREGAALKEELARSREVRLTLLKKWHEARIAYDEVRVYMHACVRASILGRLFFPCLSTRSHLCTHIHRSSCSSWRRRAASTPPPGSSTTRSACSSHRIRPRPRPRPILLAPVTAERRAPTQRCRRR